VSNPADPSAISLEGRGHVVPLGWIDLDHLLVTSTTSPGKKPAELGIDAARNVVMVDNLPYGTVFAAVTATGWSCTTPAVGKAGAVTCTVDPLASGNQVATSIGVKVKAHTGRGVITNAATVSSDTADPNPSNNSASVSTTVVK